MFAWLFPLLFAHLSGAATFAPQPLSETLKNAPVIVHATAGAARVKEVESATGVRMPYTYYEMQVDESLKGNVKPGVILVRQRGGDNWVTAGAATFQQGDDVVLLLNNPESDGSYELRALAMGKMTVGSGKELSGMAFVADALAVKGDQRQIKHWRYDDLREFLRKNIGFQDSSSPVQEASLPMHNAVKVAGAGADRAAVNRLHENRAISSVSAADSPAERRPSWPILVLVVIGILFAALVLGYISNSGRSGGNQ